MWHYKFPSYEIIDFLSNLSHLEDYSQAYLSMLYARAVEWNICNKHLLKVAKEIITDTAKSSTTLEKHIPESATMF